MSATRPIGVDSNPVTSEAAVRRELDALAKGEIDHVTFLNNMKERFRFEPDDNWEVLSLLDQYYRRGKINLEVFRALKSGFAEYILGPPERASAEQPSAPTLHAAIKPAAAAAPPPVATAPSPPPVAPPAVAAAPAPPPVALRTAPPVTPAMPRAQPLFTPPVYVNQASIDTVETETYGPLGSDEHDDEVEPDAGASAGTTPTRSAQVGDLLRNRYRLDALISKGDSGTVYEANDPFRLNLPPVGKRVAIKVLRLPDPRGIFIHQLRQEFHHLQMLSHPNIVRAFDFDRDGEVAFFTMELLNGEHLNRALNQRGTPLQRAHALAIIRDVGSAVAYAHSRGIAHGDVNPQNIFVTARGDIRVLGFGASTKLSGTASEPEFERASALAETYRHASCEVMQGGRPDTSDDLYSLSCLSYLLLTGKHAYSDRTSVEARAERRRPRRPSRLTYRQWQTLRAGLQTDAKKRPTDVQSWLQGMELDAAAKQLPSSDELMQSAEGRSRGLWWAFGGLGVAALVGGGYWAYLNQDKIASLRPHPAPEVAVTPSSVPPDASVTTATPSSAMRPTAAPPPVSAPPAAGMPATGSAAVKPTALPPPVARQPGAVPTVPTVAPATTARAAPAASKVEMAMDTMDAAATDTVVNVTVRRKGNLHGTTIFTWWTESGTAKPGVDFAPVSPHVQEMQDGQASVVLSVPVIGTVRAQDKGFYVGIEEADGGAQIGARSLTQITLPATN